MYILYTALIEKSRNLLKRFFRDIAFNVHHKAPFSRFSSSSTSSSSNFSPICVNTCRNSAALTLPLPFLSNTLKASFNSSSES